MKMAFSVLSGDLNEVLDDLQGSVYFVKRLSSTNALRWSSTGRRYGQLSMPRWFVLEHGNKFRRAVELRSDLSFNNRWPHWLSFCPSRQVPEVTFQGKRWLEFVITHGLVKGDMLVFSLTAMSQFQVYVFDENGDPKGPQSIHAPMRWFEAIQQPPKQVAYLESGDKMSELAKHTRNEQEDLSKSVPCLPSFSKRLAAINVSRLEIPRDFVSAHRRQLRDPIQLHGIHEESPTQTNVRCICYTANGVDRLFLKGDGWDDFLRENELCFGQELVFTLTADSCFTVKKEISWSPVTGLKHGSRTPMSQRMMDAGPSVNCS